MFALVVIFSFLQVCRIDSFGRGAPGDVEKTRDVVCNLLEPLHFNESFQPDHTNPFIVDVILAVDSSYAEVILSVADEESDDLIMGFLVQARSNRDIVGTFDTNVTENITLTCDNTTVSQYKKQWKKKIQLIWLPSEGFKGTVSFQGVILKNTTEFWEFETSEYFVDAGISKQAADSSGSFKCPNGDCLVTWRAEGNKIRFGVNARPTDAPSNPYVALGLSHDKTMGNDSVTECYLKHDGTQIVRMSWNDGYSNEVLQQPLRSIEPETSSVTYNAGVLRCSFARYRTATLDPQTASSKAENLFYPGEDKYHLLVAIGYLHDGEKQMHAARYASSDRIDFEASSESHGGEISYGKYLVKVHGIMMTVAWMFLASFSSLLPRFFKTKFQNVRIFHKPVWFALHQSGMILASCLTALAFVIIFISVGGYAQLSGPAAWHPPLGIVVTFLVVLNPFMAIFRCQPQSKNRWIFDHFHFFVGQSAVILAAITIFLSISIKKANLPYWLNWVLVVFVCWHVMTELILSALDKYTLSLISSNSLPEEMPMTNDGRHENKIQSKMSLTSERLPLLILIIYLIGSILMTTVVATAICSS